MSLDVVLGFIGAGNMAMAIAQGMLKKGLIKGPHIIVSAPNSGSLGTWTPLSVKTTQSNAEVVEKSDIIILAVKPHQLDSALQSVGLFKTNIPSKLFVSVLAGVTSKVLFSKITQYVCKNPRVVRVMPNTLAMICEGCTAITSHSSATPKDVQIVNDIFSALGKCEVVSEDLMHAITGVSGSGPAYVYAVIEALSDGGVKQGLPRELATTFAAQTVLGAAKMVLETKKHPGVLKDEVCSAGGTTIHAVHALEKGKLRATLISAVEAASHRSEEMSKQQIQQ